MKLIAAAAFEALCDVRGDGQHRASELPGKGGQVNIARPEAGLLPSDQVFESFNSFAHSPNCPSGQTRSTTCRALSPQSSVLSPQSSSDLLQLLFDRLAPVQIGVEIGRAHV